MINSSWKNRGMQFAVLTAFLLGNILHAQLTFHGLTLFSPMSEVKKSVTSFKQDKESSNPLSYVARMDGESFNLTLEFLKELDLDPDVDKVNFFAATPYPGTDLYEHPNEYGIQILHEDWDLYDNEHLILKLNSIKFSELEKIFKQAKEIERIYG